MEFTPFPLPSIDPEIFESDLEEQGRTSQPEQQIVVSLLRPTQERRWGTTIMGMELCGGVDTPNEVCILEGF